jgi:transposase-like protein
MQMAEKGTEVRRLDDGTYSVRSQSGRGEYTVVSTELGWRCACPDFEFRQVKCKHVWCVELSQKLRFAVEQRTLRIRTVEPIEATQCIYCQSKRLTKWGIRHNKAGDIQKFACKSCGRFFTINLGFERMKHNPKAITTAMQLYFSGESLRSTERSLRLLGIEVDHTTVFKWIRKYVALMDGYIETLKPQVSDTWRADELWVRIKGDRKYLFAMMDDETRYWIAQEVADTKEKHDVTHMFQESKLVSHKVPSTLITDGLPSYYLAFKKVFANMRYDCKPTHLRDISFEGHVHNNKMERMNGEVRDREKVFRGLKTKETPILKGYQVFHNYIRPHEALKGKTPAEACGIKVEGENRWLTLIQNATAEQRRRRELRGRPASVGF